MPLLIPGLAAGNLKRSRAAPMRPSGFGGLRRPRRHRFLPISPVESPRFDCGEINAIQTTNVHVDLVRVRSRNIERVNTAGFAESMLPTAIAAEGIAVVKRLKETENGDDGDDGEDFRTLSVERRHDFGKRGSPSHSDLEGT